MTFLLGDDGQIRSVKKIKKNLLPSSQSLYEYFIDFLADVIILIENFYCNILQAWHDNYFLNDLKYLVVYFFMT